jgi:alpha-amylase/alpha-mannosidase (GH57 family)
VESGFWGYFLRPLLDRYRAGKLGFAPIHISDYLRRYPPTEEVEVHRGAWNTEHHWGGDFMQWTGSLLQKKGYDEVGHASDYYWQVRKSFDERKAAGLANSEEIESLLTRAYDYLLTAETSCNFYWGSRWVHRSFDELEQTYFLLDTAKAKLGQI